MGRRFFPTIFAAVVVLGLLVAAPAWAEPAAPERPEKVFRLAYVQAYPYWSYTQAFEYVREYLQQAGWGDRVAFPEELHFSWGTGDESKEAQRRLAREILARDDYDLILSFGTTATRILLEENDRRRPIVGLSISDPLGSKLIVSPTDSGADYFTTVTYDERPGRYMFILFHELMKFKSLGIMYHDDEDSRVYSYLDDAREVARDRGFKLIEYSRIGPGEPLADCFEATRTLIDQGAEALFLPNTTCFDAKKNDLRPLFEYIYQRKTPTFASEDRNLVRRFALMGLFFSDVAPLASFQGDQIIQILSGRSPGEVGMVAPFHSRIMVNLAAAERLGLKLDMGLLVLSDELYLSLPGLDSNSSGLPAQAP